MKKLLITLCALAGTLAAQPQPKVVRVIPRNATRTFPVPCQAIRPTALKAAARTGLSANAVRFADGENECDVSLRAETPVKDKVFKEIIRSYHLTPGRVSPGK